MKAMPSPLMGLLENEAALLKDALRLDPTAGASKPPGDFRYVDISQIFLRAEDFNLAGGRVLCVMRVSLTVSGETARTQRLLFAVEDAGGLSGRNPEDVHLGGVRVGRVPSANGVDAAVMFFYAPGGRSAQRVVEDIQRLLPSIDYDVDFVGSQRIAEAVLDRIEVLARLPG